MSQDSYDPLSPEAGFTYEKLVQFRDSCEIIRKQQPQSTGFDWQRRKLPPRRFPIEEMAQLSKEMLQ